MRRAAKRKVSYVITHNKDDHGHLLGINSLALDTTTVNSLSGKPEGILYSAGRDGVINSWDLHLPLREQTMPKYGNLNGINGVEEKDSNEKGSDDDVPLHKFNEVKNWETDEEALSSQPTPKSTFRQSYQSHTDWVNDIILCHDNETLISCSSDRTMKLWHPHKTSVSYTIGYHTDYIKALAYASGPGWVASGGFDRKIFLWDINECRPPSSSGLGGSNFVGSERDMQPIVTISETSPKSSIYALACNSSGSVLVSGSPEKVIKVWDPKSGKRITKLSGHTDNIRAILISDDGELILTGSSDTTIKLWSLTAQRCINTFTLHSDSIWSLYSDHPRLEVFYAGSKDGLVTRTDYSGYEEVGDGECVAVCKENAGVVKLVTFDNKYIWTATYGSSIKRWLDIPMRKNERKFSMTSSPPSFPQNTIQIPPSSVIKLTPAAVTSSPVQIPTISPPTSADSEVATIYSVAIDDRYDNEDYEDPIPVREKADHIIEGQHGLIKYVMLNNRRNILTLDNNDEVTLWDIIKCIRVKVFGKCNIDEVAQEINTPESIPNWCSVDTRIGALTIHLDESKCFDAEMYADEAGLQDDAEVKEDLRINLGKWVLRHLFAKFTQTEIQTYEEIQQQRLLMQQQRQQQTGNEHKSIFSSQVNVNIPPQAATSSTCTSPTTTNPNPNPLIPQSPTAPLAAFTTGPFTAPATTSSQSSDYFSGPHHLNSPPTSPSTPPSGNSNNTTTEGGNNNGNTSTSPNVVVTNIQPPPPALVNQNTTSMGFINVKLNRLLRGSKVARNDNSKPEGTTGNTASSNSNKNTTTTDNDAKQQQSQEGDTTQQTNDDTTGLSSPSHNIPTPTLYHSPNNHHYYPIRQMHPLIQPPFGPYPAHETPELHIPEHTTVIISEESYEASTSVDLYRGTVGDMERDAEMIEQKAPTWLIEFLIKNKIPAKEPVKISFILKPHEGSELDELPNGNAKLTANRMLRARKVMTYIVEKLELDQPPISAINSNDSSAVSTVNKDNGVGNTTSEDGKTLNDVGKKTNEQETNTANNAGQNTAATKEERNNAMKPELWLELVCQDQVLSPTMTLATIKSHTWKSGGDLIMTYRLRMRSV